MKRRNEHTSARVAKIAGKILAQDVPPARAVRVIWYDRQDFLRAVVFKWSDLRAICASALTQTADKPVPSLKLIKRHRARVRNPKALKGGRRR